MRKLKRFKVGNLTMLNQQEMMDLSGGVQNFTCNIEINVIKEMEHRCLKVIFCFMMISSTLLSWGQSVTLTGQIKNAFTRQAIPNVTVTMMRSDSTIIQDSLMVMPMDGYTLWVKMDMPRVSQKVILRVTHPEFETAYLTYNLKNFGRNRQINLPDILMDRKVSRSIIQYNSVKIWR